MFSGDALRKNVTPGTTSRSSVTSRSVDTVTTPKPVQSNWYGSSPSILSNITNLTSNITSNLDIIIEKIDVFRLSNHGV